MLEQKKAIKVSIALATILFIFSGYINSAANMINFFSAVSLIAAGFAIIYPFIWIRGGFDREEQKLELELLIISVGMGILSFGYIWLKG
ncbi:hypothetical protein HN858_04735 [Candidatus Falkowbacteria bacterium]|jgi:hypothetical protein|nr:hypothetical protein [Candidatus Falkowbacteria bacterium]MBT5502617.1 hypothetical protein [Candidatus Falkowbacteria bacterium]MBT6574444.1 hypothetical protein [Candidatus Falkowbacteria bacterium]MBT7348946.1 hypothetical protein [Candidatus Falkowbacteria bacterium]MBT7500327.1 hypothetical protein [Candidatus Falkowbacteria bacterium]